MPLDPASQAVYEATHFGRGRDTVSLAGLFDLAHDLHLASMALSRVAERTPRGTSPKDAASRTALLRLAAAVLTDERNKLLDHFAKEWRSGNMDLNPTEPMEDDDQSGILPESAGYPNCDICRDPYDGHVKVVFDTTTKHFCKHCAGELVRELSIALEQR